MSKNGKKKTNGNGLTILSIDPGCRHTGWCICTFTPSGKIRVVQHGVFEHDYNPEENAQFIKSILATNMVVLIEDPPIIRVNASTSHVLAKIFGAILGVVATSDVISYERIPPKSWQHSVLREHYQKAKDSGEKITAREKDALLKALVNKNITRKREISNPHVIDTLGMIIFYCKRNGREFLPVVMTKVLKDLSIKRKKRTKKNATRKGRKRNGA